MAQKTSPRKRSGGLLGKIGKLAERFTEADKIGGGIDAETRMIDPQGALLLREVIVAEVGLERGSEQPGELALAIELRGSLNRREGEANPLILASPETAAQLVAQILTVARAGRVGPELEMVLAELMLESGGN